MRISDRYIGRDILIGTLFAIFLLSFLLVLGNVFKEIRPLLVEVGAPIWVLGDLILSVLPFSLIFTIPWAFLSAVLLVFGRMSSDNELNAFRAAGVSLTRLAAPVMVIGLLLSLGCLWLNLSVAPTAKKRANDIVTRSIVKDPRTLLRAGVDQSRIPDIKVWSESDDGEVFQNFHIFRMSDFDTSPGGTYIHADTATTVNDKEKKEIRLRLTGAFAEGSMGDGNGDDSQDLTLLARDLEWMVLPYGDDYRIGKPRPGSMSNADIDRYLETYPGLHPDYIARFRAAQVRRYTSSFACFVFAFIGVPLGIRARRRDTSTGLIISLGIGLAYFLADSLIEPSEERMFLLWLPNLLCLALGVVLFRRARFR